MPTSAIISAFEKMPRHVDQTSGSRNNLEKSKTKPYKNRWDPISITYTKLLLRLLERQLIALSHIPLIKPPFSKWYNPNVHCDYHVGKLGHSTEDCNSFKRKVQALIKMGLINFESPNQSNNLSLNFSGVKTIEVKEFATINEGIQGRMTGYTAKKIEEEKKASEL